MTSILLRLVTTCFLSLLITPFSPAEDRHPIDAAMDLAMDQDASTAGQTEAISGALKKWDALLNKHYQALITNLDPPAAAALKQSQRQWVAWRDLELKSLNAFYSRMDGTMYVPMRAYAAMNLTRRRALSLENLAGLVEGRDKR